MRPSPTLRPEAVLDRVLDERLQDQARHHDVEARLVHVLLHDEARAESHALDVEVLVDRGEFLAQASRSAPGREAAAASRPDSFTMSMRAVSGCERISDEIDVSVLNRKCGLI